MNLIYENNNDRFMFCTSKNLNFPIHMHTGIEFLMVKEGALSVTVGSKNYLLTEGDFIIAFPNQIHGYQTVSESEDCDSILILCPVTIAGDFMPTLLKTHPQNPFIKKDFLHEDIPYALHSLLKTPPDTSENHSIIKAYIQLILAHILPKMDLIKNNDNQSIGLMEGLISYLSEYYTEPISLSSLAIKFGVSKYGISRIFNEKMHTSFSDYINALRIDYAKILLQGTEEDILSISMICGYDTPRTFNRVFKKFCGCQPREYRRETIITRS